MPTANAKNAFESDTQRYGNIELWNMLFAYRVAGTLIIETAIKSNVSPPQPI